MTERLHFQFSVSCIGEGNGNPLQCSCLENPRDGGAWWAAIYGVAQSRTRLKWLSISISKDKMPERGLHLKSSGRSDFLSTAILNEEVTACLFSFHFQFEHVYAFLPPFHPCYHLFPNSLSPPSHLLGPSACCTSLLLLANCTAVSGASQVAQ